MQPAFCFGCPLCTGQDWATNRAEKALCSFSWSLHPDVSQGEMGDMTTCPTWANANANPTKHSHSLTYDKTQNSESTYFQRQVKTHKQELQTTSEHFWSNAHSCNIHRDHCQRRFIHPDSWFSHVSDTGIEAKHPVGAQTRLAALTGESVLSNYSWSPKKGGLHCSPGQKPGIKIPKAKPNRNSWFHVYVFVFVHSFYYW